MVSKKGLLITYNKINNIKNVATKIVGRYSKCYGGRYSTFPSTNELDRETLDVLNIKCQINNNILFHIDFISPTKSQVTFAHHIYNNRASQNTTLSRYYVNDVTYALV